MAWNARRCKCAVPDCPESKTIFPMKKVGGEHLYGEHGILPSPRFGEALIFLDPRTGVGPPKGRHSRDHAPSEEEFQSLLEVCQDERDRLIIMVLGYSGLRSREFLRMRQDWLKEGKIFVPLTDPVTGFKAKTKAAARAVPLLDISRETWYLLTDWFERHERIGFSYPTLWLRVRNAGRRAYLSKPLSPHALRAYCATKWAYRLGNPFLLMDLFGWTTPGVATAYVRSVGKALEDAVKKWNGVERPRTRRRWRRATLTQPVRRRVTKVTKLTPSEPF